MEANGLPETDRTASRAQLRAARRFVLGVEGPGLARAAQRLGISAGYLSQLLRGTRRRRLQRSELRRLRQRGLEETGEGLARLP